VYRRFVQSGQGIIEIMATLIIFTILLGLTANTSVYLYLAHTFISAARYGARVAAIDPTMTTQTSTAQGNVVSKVQAYLTSTTGLTVATNNIQVTAPDAAGTVGSRTVTVVINYDLPLPLNVAAVVQAFGGSGAGLSSIPIHTSAMMHYEE
jgi:hypothetical protein